jgi:hypothetical protein
VHSSIWSNPKVLQEIARRIKPPDSEMGDWLNDDTWTAFMALNGAAAALKRQRKENLRLRETLNRVRNLLPGRRRIFELDRIAMELHCEADDQPMLQEQRDGLLRAALYLRRLEWDLGVMRDAIRGGTERRTDLSKLDPANWPRGPRP